MGFIILILYILLRNRFKIGSKKSEMRDFEISIRFSVAESTMCNAVDEIMYFYKY